MIIAGPNSNYAVTRIMGGLYIHTSHHTHFNIADFRCLVNKLVILCLVLSGNIIVQIMHSAVYILSLTQLHCATLTSTNITSVNGNQGDNVLYKSPTDSTLALHLLP
jgi:hypothetical protein